MHILRQDQNLHNENAEKDQTGAGDIVFKGRQVCCSVLKRLRKKKWLGIIKKTFKSYSKKFLNLDMTNLCNLQDLQLLKPLTSFSKDLL